MICATKAFSIPFGVVDVKQDGKIYGLREKPSYPFLVNTGCYIVEPEVIHAMEYNESISFPEIIEKIYFN